MMNRNYLNNEKEIEKLTKKDYFEGFMLLVSLTKDLEEEEREAFKNFILKEVDLLNNKAIKSREVKSKGEQSTIIPLIKIVLSEQKEKVCLTTLLEDYRLKTYTKKEKGVEKEEKMTSQKLAAMMKKLVDSGEVIKTMEAKKPYYQLAITEEEENPSSDVELATTEEENFNIEDEVEVK